MVWHICAIQHIHNYTTVKSLIFFTLPQSNWEKPSVELIDDFVLLSFDKPT